MLLLLILALTSLGSGIKYDGLKVKFGFSNALADKEYFFSIPRTIHDVEAEGWPRTERPKGPLQELQMYCPPGRIACPLYGSDGFVAGLQMAVPLNSIDPSLKPEAYLEKWHAPAVGEDPAGDFWTATQYYVTENILKAGGGPTVKNGATLQNGSVWVKGLDGKMLRIPTKEAELKQTDYKWQNCIPNMGTHYYYNMTKELDCDKILPWFVLVTKEDVLGVGFYTFGTRPTIKDKRRQWFENVASTKKVIFPVTPSAPDCYPELNVKYGMLSIHVYYISKPWELKCESGDSIEPALANAMDLVPEDVTQII